MCGSPNNFESLKILFGLSRALPVLPAGKVVAFNVFSMLNHACAASAEENVCDLAVDCSGKRDCSKKCLTCHRIFCTRFWTVFGSVWHQPESWLRVARLHNSEHR